LAQACAASGEPTHCFRREISCSAVMSPPAAQPMDAFFPISELSAYQAKWKIRARITNKAPLRTFNRGNNQGKVFSVDLLDAGGEIRATFFNDAADKFYGMLEVQKVYTFTRGAVKVANRQFNNCKHRYELIFDKLAEVEETADDAQIEAMRLHIENLRTVSTRSLPCTVDLCGVLTSYSSAVNFTSKEGKDITKRTITLADDTGYSLEVALFGERAKQDDSAFAGKPVICLKSVLLKEWNGNKSSSLLESGAIVAKPTGLDVERVQRWWSQGGSQQSFTQISQSGGGGAGRDAPAGKSMDLSAMKRATDQVLDQAQYFTCVSRLALVQTRKQGEVQPLYYMACQEPKEGNGFPCNRRLDLEGFCATCNRAGKAAPRFNLRCRFTDYGDSSWLTTFHEGAVKVLAMTAEEARALEAGEGGREALEAAVRARYFSEPLQVTVKAKLDSYNGEPRTNATCIDVRPVNRAQHGRAMLQQIREMLAASAD